jgi:hypothetical protein
MFILHSPKCIHYNNNNNNNNNNNLIGIVRVDPLGTAATNRPLVPAPGDYDDGEIGGMIGRGNRSTRKKPAPLQLCPPQTHYNNNIRCIIWFRN